MKTNIFFSTSIISLIFVTFCYCSKNEKPILKKDDIYPKKIFEKTLNYIGFVTLVPKSNGNKIILYGENKKTYETFTLSKLDNNIEPFALSPDNYLLVFKCTKEIGDWYQVISNEKSNTIKYISKKDINFKFETKAEHILTAFSVDFNNGDNPIRQKPIFKSTLIPYDNEEFYNPVETKGDWLKIRWGSEGNWQYGWIKWQEKDNLIIKLFYFA